MPLDVRMLRPNRPHFEPPGFQPTTAWFIGLSEIRVSGFCRRSCDRCGLSDPSVETRFAKSGVFAGE